MFVHQKIAAEPLLQPPNLHHPAFDFIRPLLDRIDQAHLIESLNALAVERNIALSFMTAPSQKVSAVEYERRIVHDHQLIVNDSLHDLFNACIWLTFPRTKRSISELHVELGAGEHNRRPRRRDVLTLFDESGLLLLCIPALCDEFQKLNASHQWKKLFAEFRETFQKSVMPVLFGHGALEQLALAWHRGLTVKAQWLAIEPGASLTDLDQSLSAQIANGEALREDEKRIPIPLLGVPGWFAESEDPCCYDDTSIFRPLRNR